MTRYLLDANARLRAALERLVPLAETGGIFAHLNEYGLFSEHTGAFADCDDKQCVEVQNKIAAARAIIAAETAPDHEHHWVDVLYPDDMVWFYCTRCEQKHIEPRAWEQRKSALAAEATPDPPRRPNPADLKSKY